MHASSFPDRGPTHIAVERRPTPLPARVESPSDLERWREEADEAERALRSLESGRARMLTSATVEALRKHDEAIATARVRVERAEAVVRQAEEREAERAAALAAEQPERRKAYTAALRARDEAERLIREEYGPAATRIAKALARVAELRGMIDAANDRRPEGAARIPSPDAFRGYPGREPSTRTETETYYVDGDGVEVKPPAVVSRGGPAPARVSDPRTDATPRTRELTVSVPGAPGYEPQPLEREVRLPRVMHDEAHPWMAASQ